VAAGGTQAFYDWNEVSLLDAGGRHREIIPDGKLCSAGREKYRGLDLPRADWPAKRISAGQLTITYHATAPHAESDFEFYITRQGWDPTEPLRWSDLVLLRTFLDQNPTTFTTWTLTIPHRTGRHIIYSIWQRVVGSTEAFYTCSDVDFGRGSSPPVATTPTSSAPATPPLKTPAPTIQPRAAGAWTVRAAYQVGARITYGGRTYQCRQAHIAIPGWEPPDTLALWLPA
jgi:chitin-binding protein